MMTKDQAMALALIALAVSAVVVAAAVYYVLRIKGYGKIKVVGLKAYADPELTKEVSTIYWGEIPKGSYSVTTLWLKCTSTVPSNLTMHTEAWDPAAAEQYLTLTWDYDGHTLNPGEVLELELKLTVAEETMGVTDFSFDIVLTAAA